jgi:hypothetical protein
MPLVLPGCPRNRLPQFGGIGNVLLASALHNETLQRSAKRTVPRNFAFGTAIIENSISIFGAPIACRLLFPPV